MSVPPLLPGPDNSPWKVLIIDDDEDDFLITYTMLLNARGRKIEVQWANTYEAGWSQLQQGAFHAVLVDYDLGPRSGIQLIQEANRGGCHAPLILYTGHGSYEIDIEAMQAGATLYLTKGEVSSLLLERAIRYAIELKSKENELRLAQERLEKELLERRRVEESLGQSTALLARSEEKFEKALKASASSLRDTTEQFYKAFNLNPNPQVISGLEDGRIQAVNESFVRLFGYSTAEVLGKTSLELNLLRPEDRQAGVEKIKAQGYFRGMDIQVRTRSGEFRRISLDAELIYISGKACLLTGLQDVTEQKKLEEENYQSKDLLERVIHFAPAAIAFLHGPQHVYRFVNAEYEKIARGKGSLIGLPLEEAWPELAGDVVPQLDRVYRTGVPFSVTDAPLTIVRQGEPEENYFTYTFSPIYRADGTIEGVMTLVVETTESVRARMALTAQSARLTTVLQALPVGVWITDRSGRIIGKNEQADRIWAGEAPLSEDMQQYLEYKMYDPASGNPWPLDDYPLVCVLNSGQPYPPRELSIRRFDGTPGAIIISAAPTHDPDGSLNGAVAVCVDITERKLASEKLQHYSRELERSNQALQDFAFVASHDLQEPLRKIIMFGKNLDERLDGSSEDSARDYVVRMQRAAERMQSMIDGLLELSRVNARSRNFTQVDLSKVVDEVVSDLEVGIRAVRGEVICRDLPTIQADELQIRQLFQNLIGNALKFHRPDVPPRVLVSGTLTGSLAGPLVEIRVQDNGIGFDPRRAGRIFQPFQRLHGKGEYAGTGLGLAICQKIVERHNGSIWFEALLGQGSTFIIQLPAQANGWPPE
jgi:PAS domain S-box-containing protein